jgi:ribonuclease HI
MGLIKIWTDGACRGNPGVGGWGVYIYGDNWEERLYGHGGITTNNEMELTAAVKGLQSLGEDSQKEVELLSDSNYVITGMNTWIENWKKKGWKTTKGAVKNLELWKELDRLSKIHKITWTWVKGHSTDEGNIEADRLANLGVDKC